MTPAEEFKIKVLLVDDQKIIAEAIERMLKSQSDISFYYCQDPMQAITMASRVQPTVILQDLAMPQIDGLLLVRYFRANASTKDVPMIVLSSKEEPQIKAEAFARGANDYIVKLPDQAELLARIRYHSAAYIRLLERNAAYAKLQESQNKLKHDLEEAADYVRALLPQPINEKIVTEWRYIPSLMLGGDSFDYRWLDKDHFGFYLLDVCGHGVGAALLSISAVNVLRTDHLGKVDMRDPAQVLGALNQVFQMENHNNMFFTLWYGVFNAATRKLKYACAGHPPAVLFQGNKEPVLLHDKALAIGAMPDTVYRNKEQEISGGSILYLFSDGVFEIQDKEGREGNFEEFLGILKTGQNLESVFEWAFEQKGEVPFDDDYSIIKMEFK